MKRLLLGLAALLTIAMPVLGQTIPPWPATPNVFLATPCLTAGTPAWRTICSTDLAAVFSTPNTWTGLQTFTGGITLPTQIAGAVFAGPASGAPAVPAFRALVPADFTSAMTFPWSQPSNVVYDPYRVVVNSFPLSSEFGGNTSSVVQALVGAIDVPSTATGTLMSGVSGYSRTASTASDAVGIFGEGEANAANVSVWGGNVVASNAPGFALNDGTGFDLASLIGLEIDTAVSKKSGNVIPNIPIIGLWITGSATAQTTNIVDDAIDIGYAGASTNTPWKDAIRIRTGASNVAAIEIDQAGTGASQVSQGLELVSTDAVNTAHINDIYGDNALGSLVLANSTGACTEITNAVGGPVTFWSCSTQVRAFQPFLFTQLQDQSAIPTISACGTSPAITAGSTNSSGQFTTGTGSPTACTITFSASGWPNNAFCTATSANSIAAAIAGQAFIATSSKTSFVMTLAGTGGAIYNYTCAGH